MQDDATLRTYPEYDQGRTDAMNGVPSQHLNYPLISTGGRFEKKAYRMGYSDGRNA